MFRKTSLTFAILLATSTAVFAQMPPQPAPPNMSSGDAKERAACQPDVMRFCKAEVEANAQDVLGILACLQRNRTSISHACGNVLKSHGQ